MMRILINLLAFLTLTACVTSEDPNRNQFYNKPEYKGLTDQELNGITIDEFRRENIIAYDIKKATEKRALNVMKKFCEVRDKTAVRFNNKKLYVLTTENGTSNHGFSTTPPNKPFTHIWIYFKCEKL